jgi:hypothetical protein
MVLPNVDLSKLSKLRQRLVAPSSFSTQYLFPGNQAFFRDFILCCDFHMMFIEQLKIALISELLQMNDSSMETLSVTHGNTGDSNNTDTDDDNKEKSFQQEFIVSRCNLVYFFFSSRYTSAQYSINTFFSSSFMVLICSRRGEKCAKRVMVTAQSIQILSSF